MKKKLLTKEVKRSVADAAMKASDAACWVCAGADIAFRLAKCSAFNKKLNALTTVCIAINLGSALYIVLQDRKEEKERKESRDQAINKAREEEQFA